MNSKIISGPKTTNLTANVKPYEISSSSTQNPTFSNSSIQNPIFSNQSPLLSGYQSNYISPTQSQQFKSSFNQQPNIFPSLFESPTQSPKKNSNQSFEHSLLRYQQNPPKLNLNFF